MSTYQGEEQERDQRSVLGIDRAQQRATTMDYKDAYHALRSQHSDLQRKYHDRAEELKRTNVQLSKIEHLMRAKERMEAPYFRRRLIR